MTTSEWTSPELRQHGRALWYGALAGPLGWTVHLLVSYVMTALACAKGWPGVTILGLSGAQFIMTVFTIVVELVIAAAGVTAAREWRRVGSPQRWSGAQFEPWMARAGVLVSGMFFVAVLFAGVPALALAACR